MASALALTEDPNGSFWLKTDEGDMVHEWRFIPPLLDSDQQTIHYLHQSTTKHERKRARLALPDAPIDHQGRIGRRIYEFVDDCCKLHAYLYTTSNKELNLNLDVEWYAVLKNPVLLANLVPRGSPKLPALVALLRESQSVDDLVAAHLYANAVARYVTKTKWNAYVVVLYTPHDKAFHEFQIYQSTMRIASSSNGTELLTKYASTYDIVEGLVPAGEFVVSHLLCNMIMHPPSKDKDRNDVLTILALRTLVFTYPRDRMTGSGFFQDFDNLFRDETRRIGPNIEHDDDASESEEFWITMQSLRESGIGPLEWTYDLDNSSVLGSGTYGTVYETVSKQALKVYEPNKADCQQGLVIRPIEDSRMWSQTLELMQTRIGDLIVPVLLPYVYALVKRFGKWKVRLVSLMEKCTPLPRPMDSKTRSAFADWMLDVCNQLKDSGFVAPDLKIANVGIHNTRFCLIDLDGIDTQDSAPALWEDEGNMWWPAGTHAAITPDSKLDGALKQKFIKVMEIGDPEARWDLATYQTYFAGFVTAVAIFHQKQSFYFTSGLPIPYNDDGFFKPRFEKVAEWVASLKGGLDARFVDRYEQLRTWWDLHPLRKQKSEFLAGFSDLAV